MRVRAALPALLAAAPMLAGCEGWQSALDMHGPQAARIHGLFMVFLVVCGAVWALVALALLLGLARRRAAMAADASPLDTDPRAERRAERIVTAAILATAAALVVLTALSYRTGKGLAALQGREDALEIRLTGHQWWWEVRYEDPQPHRVLTTANEIHIPVGRPVRILLASTDVIHSFWVPSLHGKRDLIPGRENEIWLRADSPGSFRGQCAEFCGAQHARMGLLVVAQPPAEFESWRDAQLAPAEPPSEPERQRGLEVFQTGPCVMCHTVRGTLAGGKVAPELTHLASRSALAAGTLPMTRGALAAWITDPQSVKPGAHMPLIQLPAEDFQALLAYLEGLR